MKAINKIQNALDDATEDAPLCMLPDDVVSGFLVLGFSVPDDFVGSTVVSVAPSSDFVSVLSSEVSPPVSEAVDGNSDLVSTDDSVSWSSGTELGDKSAVSSGEILWLPMASADVVIMISPSAVRVDETDADTSSVITEDDTNESVLSTTSLSCSSVLPTSCTFINEAPEHTFVMMNNTKREK